MTKIAFASDLHLEFGPRDFALPDADILLLAGDIHQVSLFKTAFAETKFGVNIRKFFHDVSNKYKTTIYIPGNHEHYDGCISTTTEKVNVFLKEEGIDNIIFGDYGSHTINDIKIVYATMWTDLKNGNPIVMNAAQYGMNDYQKIVVGGDHDRYFTTNDMIKIHEQHKKYILNEVSNDDKIVVMTHHAPHTILTGSRGNTSSLDYAYGCTDMDEVILNDNISHWVFGHVHTRETMTINGTEFMSNCRGYFGHEKTEDFTIKTFDV